MAKKTYFRTGDKDRVRDRLLDRKFKPLTEQLAIEKQELGYEAVRSQLKPHEWEQIDALPEGWVPLISSVRLRDPDSSYKSSYNEWKLGLTVRVPALFMGRTIGEERLPADLWARYLSLLPREDALRGERRELYRQIDATLATFRTVEAAVEGWPEAAEIITEVAGKPLPTTLPAVTTLNAALDLPPEQEAA